jgi:hypothetical protein
MAFKMKGSPMKRNFGVGASPMKNYKKGYYGEGSSMKLTDEETHEPGKNIGKSLGAIYALTKPKFTKHLKKRSRIIPESRYTGRKPQSQMTDAEYKAYLKSLEKKK